MEYSVDRNGDTTVKLNKFVIKDDSPLEENEERRHSKVYVIKIDGIEKQRVRLKES